MPPFEGKFYVMDFYPKTFFYHYDVMNVALAWEQDVESFVQKVTKPWC